MMNVADRPILTCAGAEEVLVARYGMVGEAIALPGERDLNFRIETTAGRRYVLKIAHPDESADVLDLQTAAMSVLSHGSCASVTPLIVRSVDEELTSAWSIDSREHFVRLVSYLPGTPIAQTDLTPALLEDFGTSLALLDRDLAAFAHPMMHRFMIWDSKHAASVLGRHLADIGDGARRKLVAELVGRLIARIGEQMAHLPMQVIHNDANDYNILVEGERVTGIIDFGDMVHSYRVCELANALAYLLPGASSLDEVSVPLIGGYESVTPLTDAERAALGDFALLRACLTVSIGARQMRDDPTNEYLGISQASAWSLIERYREGLTIGVGPRSIRRRAKEELIAARSRLLCGALSTSYRSPLKIVRGAGAYLFDEEGRAYLDCVNNVCHVGHCHPRVVSAASAQMERLNTNTRYLHDNLIEYAERLSGLFPDPLTVCFFVNSGSEANDLALRLARAHTGRADMIVLDHAYHGHTQSLIDISPYKFNGRGGRGAPPTTHVVPIPDRYRGPYGYDDPEAGVKYARSIEEAVETLRSSDRAPAGFIAESILGVAGQIELPRGYLECGYAAVRSAGGLCIADEVQVGFGRIGTAMWAFETHGVVPDIVTLGKPIGNGHPLAAVITTSEIASSFDNGMEYFNTFGGNPVSCAIGLAVLDVIESDGLQEHAREVGETLLADLRALGNDHALIGDVRGRGLFIGVELVRDRSTREPATEEAASIVEFMKDAGALVSTDGPFQCVLKLKPPLALSSEDAGRIIAVLEQALRRF